VDTFHNVHDLQNGKLLCFKGEQIPALPFTNVLSAESVDRGLVACITPSPKTLVTLPAPHIR
jgi:hypothetical protein